MVTSGEDDRGDVSEGVLASPLWRGGMQGDDWGASQREFLHVTEGVSSCD